MAAKTAVDRGSATTEFVLVGALLTVLTLSVLQLAFIVHVRNTALDAAVEGARFAALADGELNAGVTRTTDLIASALSDGYANDVSARYMSFLDRPAVEVRVVVPLPLIGLVGPPAVLEVTGHAPVEAIP